MCRNCLQPVCRNRDQGAIAYYGQLRSNVTRTSAVSAAAAVCQPQIICANGDRIWRRRCASVPFVDTPVLQNGKVPVPVAARSKAVVTLHPYLADILHRHTRPTAAEQTNAFQ
jgi:hypothetical protein